MMLHIRKIVLLKLSSVFPMSEISLANPDPKWLFYTYRLTLHVCFAISRIVSPAIQQITSFMPKPSTWLVSCLLYLQGNHEDIGHQPLPEVFTH